MKKYLQIVAAVAALIAAAGCVGIAAAPAASVAPHAGEALVQALVKNDAAAFIAQLPPEVAEEFNANGFRETRKTLVDQVGEPVKYEFLVNLTHPKFTLSVWLIHCERKSSDGKETIRQDMLFRVVSGKMSDGKEKLLQFQFL